MQEHEEWLLIAKEDLKMAKLALSAELFSPVTYSCQQAAEKSLKGYLAFKNQEILKTHDLSKLIELCKDFDLGFNKFYGAVEYLNPFATRFRYPTEFDIPDLEVAELAVKHAESILKFVLKKISEPGTGQTGTGQTGTGQMSI